MIKAKRSKSISNSKASIHCTFLFLIQGSGKRNMFLLSTKTFYSSYTVEKFLHPGTSFIVREALHINKVSNTTCYKNQQWQHNAEAYLQSHNVVSDGVLRLLLLPFSRIPTPPLHFHYQTQRRERITYGAL